MLLEHLIAQTATKPSGLATAANTTQLSSGGASSSPNSLTLFDPSTEQTLPGNAQVDGCASSACNRIGAGHPPNVNLFRALLNPIPRRKPTDHERQMSIVRRPESTAAQSHAAPSPEQASTILDDDVIMQREGEDNADVLLRLGPFEARKAAAISKFHSATVDISARELRVLHFLASVDHGRDRPDIACNVETKNFRLQWVLDPSARGPDVASMNLESLRTDILFADRKPLEQITVPLLDSPRSVLTCLRNGIQPIELQEVPLDAMILEFSAKGYQRDMIVKRHAFQESLRQHKLESLRNEYHKLCELISLEDICTFFEFTALNDGLQAPDVVHAEQQPSSSVDSAHNSSRRKRVIVSGDPTIFDAVRKIEEKSSQDRKRLTTVLQQELDNTALRTAAFVKDQAKNAAKTRAHERELQLREEERRQAAAERKIRSEQKALHRSKLVDEAEERKLEDILARQRRAAEAEQQAEVALKRRADQRRARQEEKHGAQAVRLEQAEVRVAQIDASRRARFDEKQQLRNALLRQKEFLRERKKEDDLQAREILAERRRVISERGEAVAQQKLQKAKLKTLQVEERMREFAAQKESEMKFKKVVELRNELNREEVFVENEKRLQDNIDTILERRKAHEESFEQFQALQSAKRQSIRERELQVMLMKEGDRQRHEQKHAYQLLLSAEECVRKVARAKQLEQTREMQGEVLERERATMSLLREDTLEAAEKSMVAQERVNYLALFRESSPGDAELLRRTNAWNLQMHRSHRRGQQRCGTVTSPEPCGDLSAISAIRPATSLDKPQHRLPPL